MAGALAAAGLVLLFAGGEFVVRGGVSLARRLGLPQLLIGLVIVGFATSAPELVVSVSAAFEGAPSIAVGNVVGSTVANLLLILGASALVRPIALELHRARSESLMMLLAILMLQVAALMGGLSRLAGAGFVVVLVAYLSWAYAVERRGRQVELPMCADTAEEKCLSTPRALLLVGGGLAALVAGAQLLVSGAVDLARLFGVPEAVIGLTLVAIGTSLPELATSIVAAVRGHSDIAAGNVLGSNLFNVLGILGVTAVIRPLAIERGIAVVDIPVALLSAVVLLPVLTGRIRLGRLGGGALLAGYFVYLIARFV